MKNTLILLVSAFLLAGCCEMQSPISSCSQSDIDMITGKAPFSMPKVSIPQFPDLTKSVTDFGAVADGLTLCTSAFQDAIDEVAQKGGGTVLVPAGVYLTGPIVLKSNVRLYIDYNALVMFSPDYRLYPIIDASFEGLDTKRCQSPISAVNAENIAICGHGVINGNGDYWRPVKKAKLTAKQWEQQLKRGGVVSEDGKTWYPSEAALFGQSLCEDQNVPIVAEDSVWEQIHQFLRPVMVSIIGSKNILLEGVTFENSPAWNLHPLMSENVILSDLTVRNPWYSQNGDGVDVESCKNVIIKGCTFDVGDDAICMKSGKGEDGWRRAMPTENIIVSNCTVFHGHGGFVVGSEMSGDVRNIQVNNCLFIGTDVGLRFKSTRGRGGIVENIYIKGINMTNIPTDPLLFDLFYGGKGAGEETQEEIEARMRSEIPEVNQGTPQFKDIFIEDVVCNHAQRAMYFNGLPEMKVKNVSLKNIFVNAQQPAVVNQTDGLTIENVTICVPESAGKNMHLNNVDNVKLLSTPNSQF